VPATRHRGGRSAPPARAGFGLRVFYSMIPVLILLAGLAIWGATGGFGPAGADQSRGRLATPPAGSASARVPDPTGTPHSAGSATTSARPVQGGTARSSPTAVGLGSWPGPGNTGVPAGTRLTSYRGSCTITRAGAVIDSKALTCDVFIRAANVVIKRSKINGQVLSDNNDAYSFSLIDSEVNAGHEMNSAVSNTNVTVIRANIHGGSNAVQCSGDCTVRDSWLHGQYAPLGAGWHDDGFITNGGSNMTLVHNTIACDEGHGACSGDVFLSADFARVSHVTVDHNLLVADANVQYCTYAAANRLGSDHIVYTNNVFQRGGTGHCGKYGPVDQFDPSGTGNLWQGNTWDDGTPFTQ
jgi:hypothetical protein